MEQAGPERYEYICKIQRSSTYSTYDARDDCGDLSPLMGQIHTAGVFCNRLIYLILQGRAATDLHMYN